MRVGGVHGSPPPSQPDMVSQAELRLAAPSGSPPANFEPLAGGFSCGIVRFGASAPGGTCLKEFGFTLENVVAKAKALLG